MKPPSSTLLPLRPLPPHTLRTIPRPRFASTPSVAHPSLRPLSLYESPQASTSAFALAERLRQASAPSPHSLRSDLNLQAQRQANNELERQMPRRWKVGDVYAPHDLSSAEMEKWKGRRAMVGGGRGRVWGDVLDVLAVEPEAEYKNFSMMWEFCSKMGRIRHSRETGLRNVNQRKMARAIRRAIGMGLMPSVHKHPEILEREAQARATNNAAQGRYEARRR